MLVMENVHPGATPDITEFLCAEVLTEWLVWRFSQLELAERVERLFRRCGPTLPRRMRLDLRYFIEDRPPATLAECLAANEDPGQWREFVDWCRELAAEGRDPYRRLGLRQEDFCAERGPGDAEDV